MKKLILIIFFVLLLVGSVLAVGQFSKESENLGLIVIKTGNQESVWLQSLKNLFAIGLNPKTAKPNQDVQIQIFKTLEYKGQVQSFDLILKKGSSTIESIPLPQSLLCDIYYGCTLTLTTIFTAPSEIGEYSIGYRIMADTGVYGAIPIAEEYQSFTVATEPTTCDPATGCDSWDMYKGITGGDIYVQNCYEYKNPPTCKREITSTKYKTKCDYGYVITGTEIQEDYGQLTCCKKTTPDPTPTPENTCPEGQYYLEKDFSMEGTVFKAGECHVQLFDGDDCLWVEDGIPEKGSGAFLTKDIDDSGESEMCKSGWCYDAEPDTSPFADLGVCAEFGAYDCTSDDDCLNESYRCKSDTKSRLEGICVYQKPLNIDLSFIDDLAESLGVSPTLVWVIFIILGIFIFLGILKIIMGGR